MRGRFAVAPTGAAGLLATVALAACGWTSTKEDSRAAAGGGSVQGTGQVASGVTATSASVGGVAVPWSDPEPPGAQAAAESVVAAPFNADKTTRMTTDGKQTRLTMGITTLENRTTGLQGFQTAVTGAPTSLDERLTRLGAEVTGTEVTIRLPGSVLFDFDSAQIRPDAARTLGEVASVINGYAKRPVRVEGHTDSVASDDYNLKLSQRRADAVRAWLGANKVEAGRLATRGFGEAKPVADNATAEGRQRNRRVEVIIQKGP